MGTGVDQVGSIHLNGRPFDDPLAAIAGYAFARLEPAASTRPRQRWADDPVTKRRRWGYWSYDCIPPAEGSALSGVDLVIASALNGRMDIARVGALRAVAPQVSDHLAALEGTRPFWELGSDEVSEPSKETSEWHLGAAWELLMRQPGIDVAITHKTRHHKRPDLFPLLDNRTIAELPKGTSWLTIHRDLTDAASEWAVLEKAFETLIQPDDGEVSLTRLRMHDILLWLRATGPDEENAARDAGRRWLDDRTN